MDRHFYYHLKCLGRGNIPFHPLHGIIDLVLHDVVSINAVAKLQNTSNIQFLNKVQVFTWQFSNLHIEYYNAYQYFMYVGA